MQEARVALQEAVAAADAFAKAQADAEALANAKKFSREFFSREHFTLEEDGENGWRLYSEGRNGTKINGRGLAQGEKRHVEAGDNLSVVTSRLKMKVQTVQAQSTAPAPAPLQPAAAPDTAPVYAAALYWAVMTLTTAGNGDMQPQSSLSGNEGFGNFRSF